MKLGNIETRVKGGSRKNFRRLTEWNVENRILYGILFSIDLKLSDFADKIEVNSRTAQAWVFEGREPNDENKEKICKLLGYPEEILFYDIRN